MNNLIPKKIHYVWVGGKEKPELVKKCIDSWKKYCPDYEIVEWNDDVLQQIDNLYVKQAYENKKWAFVSDYVRLWVLYHFGGFYCDTDLEITNSIESFRKHKMIIGFEIWNGEVSPLTALIGSEKGNKIIKAWLELYDDIPFIKNGEMDETTNVVRVSRWLQEVYDFKKPYDGTRLTKLREDVLIFPYWFFCTSENDKENYAIHHFNGSWLDPYVRKCKLSLGKYKLVRFRKRAKIKGDTLPILNNEIKICQFSFWGIKWCVLKST